VSSQPVAPQVASVEHAFEQQFPEPFTPHTPDWHWALAEHDCPLARGCPVLAPPLVPPVVPPVAPPVVPVVPLEFPPPPQAVAKRKTPAATIVS
jgi:hypothetical protein